MSECKGVWQTIMETANLIFFFTERRKSETNFVHSLRPAVRIASLMVLSSDREVLNRLRLALQIKHQQRTKRARATQQHLVVGALFRLAQERIPMVRHPLQYAG